MFGLMAGMRAVSAIMLLLCLVIFLYAIVGVMFFGKNDPAHFATTQDAMRSLFQCATLSDWSVLFLVNYFGCDRYLAEG